jgi:hypothetical protein
MDNFLLDCCFNAIYEGLKFRKSTPRYANRLHVMPHSTESRLPAMPHSAELRLCAMWHSAEFFKKNFVADSALCSSTWNSIQNFLVDSVLCGTARSWLRAMWHSTESQLSTMRHSAESQLHAMPHSAESTQIRDILAKSKPNSKIF